MESMEKEIPQDSIWLDPQIERLIRVNREPSHPGDALNEFDELNVTLAISFFGKRCLTFTFRKVYNVTNLTLNIVLSEKA